MMLGLIAVFAAIVYRVGEEGRQAPALSAGAPVDAKIAIPPGYLLVAADLDGDRALLRLDGQDGTGMLILVDLATGRTLGRYPVEEE